MYSHGTIIQTGTRCQKIPCYMRDSVVGGVLMKIEKYFEVMSKFLEISSGDEKKDLEWFMQIIFHQSFNRIS